MTSWPPIQRMMPTALNAIRITAAIRNALCEMRSTPVRYAASA
jgi:hypothetical protein